MLVVAACKMRVAQASYNFKFFILVVKMSSNGSDTKMSSNGTDTVSHFFILLAFIFVIYSFIKLLNANNISIQQEFYIKKPGYYYLDVSNKNGYLKFEIYGLREDEEYAVKDNQNNKT